MQKILLLRFVNDALQLKLYFTCRNKCKSEDHIIIIQSPINGYNFWAFVFQIRIRPYIDKAIAIWNLLWFAPPSSLDMSIRVREHHLLHI